MTDPAPRKIRCRVLSLHTSDRCPNEAVTDYGMCAHHIAGAAAEFRRITGQDKP